MRGTVNNQMLTAHVPVVLLQHLREAPDELVRSLDATVLFADVSGFTRLSEKLARRGKEGAERLTDVINACFTALLAEAYENGASLIKFGGDAMLLWFDGDGHPGRACTAAVAMRSALRDLVRNQTGPDRVPLRMSIGLHSGRYETFLVGDSHHEYLIAGPAASKAVAMEGIATAGQILVSDETAKLLPASCLGSEAGPGRLLSRSPMSLGNPRRELPEAPAELVAACLSTELRRHLLAVPAAPEHRTATIAFIQFGSFDEVIATEGAQVAAERLDELVRTVQEAADRYEVCFLGSDIAGDGGKLLLSAGAPRVVGDDEERILLALRHVIDAAPKLPIRAGVNRGPVFAGEVGPYYRRTYTVMGDAVNLTARLMAKAPWRGIYASPGVLDRSQTRFEAEAVPPFMVKGKSRPVQALLVGDAQRAAPPTPAPKPLPLLGREQELAVIRHAVTAARDGIGGLVELVGESGSGKSRLLAEARELADGLGVVHTICEAYRRIPYVVWRDILRQLLGLHWADPDDVVIAAIVSRIEAGRRELLPWLPLLAVAFDVQVPMTREVSELAAEYRVPKLHEVMVEFLEPLLAVPTLVQIEHVQFMDEASAALLDAIAHRLGWSAWLVTVTRRDVDGGFAAAPESSTRLNLGSLPAEVMMELAESTSEASMVPPHMLEMVVERAGGSPAFLLDLLATAAGGSEALPDSMEAAATVRIDALDPSDRVLVRRASVLGMCFHPRLLRYVLDPDASRPDELSLSQLSAVFADDGDGYVRFKRPAICEAAYEGLPYRLRRQLHAAVGEALEPELGHNADADPAVLSLHFILAGDNGRAWKYAKAAAESAVAKFAQADAARLYRRAIEAGRHDGANNAELAECWEALGDALLQSGHAVAAGDALTAARKLIQGDRLTEARLFLRHVRIAHRQGGFTAAVRWGGRGLRVLGEATDTESREIRAQILAEVAYVRYLQGRLIEAERLCRTAIAQVDADERRPLAHAIHVLDLVLVDSGRLDEAVHSSRALAIYERLGDLVEQGNVLNSLAVIAELRSHWGEALRLYARAGETFERSGTQGGTATIESNIGEILLARGQLEEAAQHLKRARRIWSANGSGGLAAWAALALGRLEAWNGRIDEARELVAGAATELRTLGQAGDVEHAEIIMAEAEAFVGDASSALAIADPLLAASSRERPWLKRIRGVALARQGWHDAAIDELMGSLAIARERGALYDVVATLSVLETMRALPEPDAAERDSILARLGIQQIPMPDLASKEPALASKGPELALGSH
jgi:class 3 adenylate cyclase/tetratricopeptide (TPR) repeat protein